ncbi:MAG: PKD domain-containing protein, partial [Thermoplasmata archaeon]
VDVNENQVPWLTVPDSLTTAKTLTEFTVSVVDPDSGDDLMLTWDWGDGTVTFTEIPVASHTYDHRGIYILTVIVTDGTGLPGHIVSASASVVVLSPGEMNQHGGTRG